MTCTWIGQSTCFVQMDGFNILTDPIFSKTTIGDWLGVKRIRPVPCQLKELPKVDIVIVSHNHYDHLDVNVIQELGNDVTWYVPLGMASYLYRYNVTRVVELDWWQETRHVSEKGSLDIIATPIQHWSGRHFFDINATLWCSFLVRGHLNSFFHCGDTGYCSVFKEIGQLYGPVSFAALPIGSYEPRHYLCHQHMDPHEACMVHQDIQAKCSIGVHWGTFMMSDEFYLDPPREFEEARKDLELPKGSIVTKHLGETFVLPCFPLNADSWIHLED
ncbi:beta-lactamase superfamily domain-containing protein [Gorgonomyces haynaldii]|nr:beta-lactamase superfamily domain-containing protein [Gorgonomyces haynaldii]